jgi:hypothetical protein
MPQTALSDHHLHLLTTGSGIAPDVIQERGYRSLRGYAGQAELRRLGFPDFQRHVPGLLLPIHTTDGQVLPIVYRPDTPRLVEGKPLKYDQLAGSPVRLDCPPRCRPHLSNPDIPLWITEGLRKDDSLASRVACAIGLSGVYGFRVPKKLAPTQPLLPDWRYVQLADRQVTIVFDSDVTTNPDVQHARELLARMLTARGARVRYCTLSALPSGAKCGVDDFFAAGQTLADLEALATDAGASLHAEPIVIAMDTVTTRQIEWLWYPYLAIGKICVIDGDPGVGKTLFATQLAANVSRGYPMPDQEGKMTLACGGPGVVVFIATEDDLEDTVKPRLERAGADCGKIKAFNEWHDGAGKIHSFTLADLPHLETVLETYRPRLVYIDAIQAVLGGKVDANSANQLKQLLDPLARLAATYRCAMLASRHPAKPGQNNVKLIHRGANSMAIIGTARLGLFAEDHPTDKTKVLLLQSKSNAGSIGRTQTFSKHEGKFEWAGVSRITKEDLAGSGRGPDPRAFLEAYFWLEARLADGQAHTARQVLDDAERDDIGKKPLYSAKKALGVVSTQIPDGWLWRLPPFPSTTLPSGESGDTGNTGVTGESDAVTGSDDILPPDRSDTPDTPYAPDTPVSRVVSDEVADMPQGVPLDAVLSPPTDCYPPEPRPPAECPQCEKRTTWRIRPTTWVCAYCDAEIPRPAPATEGGLHG